MEKNKMSIPVSVGIASTWFGMHCGSGFATGSQYAIYYSKYGWLALITPIITWLVLAVAFYFIFEYCRITKVSSYKDYASNVFIKKIGIVFIIAIDLWSLCAQIMGVSGILAGSGSLFEEYNVNYWIGVAAAGAIVLGMVVFGSRVMMRISTYLTVGLLVCITILGFVGLAQNWDNFVQVVANHENGGGTFLDALGSALTYSGVQIGSMFAVCSMAPELRNTKESAKTAFGGAFLNLIMLQILGLVMIANYPEINAETLPVLTALSAIGIPVLRILYAIMLFLALISTGAGCAFAIVTRFKGIIAKWFKCSETISGVIIALVMMAIGVFGSQFGLTAIFSTGYGYLSKMAWPLGILPAIIILPIRIYYLKKSGGKYDYPAKAERQ